MLLSNSAVLPVTEWAKFEQINAVNQRRLCGDTQAKILLLVLPTSQV